VPQIFWPKTAPCGSARQLHGLREIIKNYETAAFLLNPTFSIAWWANHLTIGSGSSSLGVGDTGPSKSWLAPSQV